MNLSILQRSMPNHSRPIVTKKHFMKSSAACSLPKQSEKWELQNIFLLCWTAKVQKLWIRILIRWTRNQMASWIQIRYSVITDPYPDRFRSGSGSLLFFKDSQERLKKVQYPYYIIFNNGLLPYRYRYLLDNITKMSRKDRRMDP